ncbi:MAG: syntaxin domain-containing protein, partial [Thermoprotei archaeon]
MAEPILTSVLERFLEDYLTKMSEKLAKGEKLTQAEAALLVAGVAQRDVSRLIRAVDDAKADTNKRIDDVRTELLSKLDDTNKRIDDVRTELLSKLDDTNKRIDDTNKRIDDVRTELLSKLDDTNKRIDDTNKRIDDVRT